jgi:hypothetical protein
MSSRSASGRRHLASSPFKPEPEREITQFSVDDRVCHDEFGLGRVVNAEAGAVTVDFGDKTLRIVSPFNKLEHL